MREIQPWLALVALALVSGVLTWDGAALAANSNTSLYVRAVVDAGTVMLANTTSVDGDDFDENVVLLGDGGLAFDVVLAMGIEWLLCRFC